MYYVAMVIYLMKALDREKQAAGIRELESRDKCSERVAACSRSVQMNSKSLWQGLRNHHTNLMENERHMERDTGVNENTRLETQKVNILGLFGDGGDMHIDCCK